MDTNAALGNFARGGVVGSVVLRHEVAKVTVVLLDLWHEK